MRVPVLVLLLSCGCLAQQIITRYDDSNEDEQQNSILDYVSHVDNLTDNDSDNPDEYLTTPQIIRRHGYTSESHVVETKDGYLLTIHRIPASKYGRVGKQPVFIQHGLLSSSADWVITGNKSLAFILSDLGYDVWLGNARGNTYSRGHVKYLPDSVQFWNFSFHEMGVYDLPAMLSHVSNVTGKGGEIIYIGHSMGTTMFFAFASVLPDYATKTVKMMTALAPVVYTTHMKSPIRYFAPFVNNIEWIATFFGFKEFLPNGKLMKFLSFDCKLLKIDKKICEQVIFTICGFDEDQFDEKLLPVVLSHAPAGSSTKTVIHYAQEIHHDGDFIEYDYGESGNLERYGTLSPPLYNITSIKVPTYLMYAENDWLASPVDVLRLARQLSKNIGLYDVSLKTFNHVDFLWAKDAPTLVYKKLIEIIKMYSFK